MKELDKFFAAQKQVFDYFGYVEGWRVLPLSDERKYYWRLEGEGPGEVLFADTEEELFKREGNFYSYYIYTQGHLPKWVYRGKLFTMIVADTHTDGNQVLAIFRNSKERP